MVLPISGFMPIPLAIMPPFMAYQSLVMGDAFGRAFQFGKRKISAMSNEEFNKLDIVQLYENISNEYTRIIPTVEKAMAQSTQLQVVIVEEMLKIIPALAKKLFENITGGGDTPTPTPPPSAPNPPPVGEPRHPQPEPSTCNTLNTREKQNIIRRTQDALTRLKASYAHLQSAFVQNARSPEPKTTRERIARQNIELKLKILQEWNEKLQRFDGAHPECLHVRA